MVEKADEREGSWHGCLEGKIEDFQLLCKHTPNVLSANASKYDSKTRPSSHMHSYS